MFKPLNPDSAMNVFMIPLHLSILRSVPQCTFWDSTYPFWFSKDLKKILSLNRKVLIQNTNQHLIEMIIKNSLSCERDSNLNLENAATYMLKRLKLPYQITHMIFGSL